MVTFADLYRLDGRIGRAAFAFGTWGVAVLFQAGLKASLFALPWMADVLAPRGINAGFALNVIWLVLGVALVWSLIALGAKRMRDRGRSPWWAVAAVVPLAVMAMLNDAIFLVSKSLVLPAGLNWGLVGVAGLVAAAVYLDGLFGPARGDGER